MVSIVRVCLSLLCIVFPIITANTVLARCLNSTVASSYPAGTLSPLLFGTNFVISMVDNKLLADPTFHDSLTSIPLRSLRFPGGTDGDNYLWRQATTARPDWFPRDFKPGPDKLDFDEFMGLVKCLGGQPTIVLNLRSWLADGKVDMALQQAEDWVRYANVEKGYGVRFWEFGNEVYSKRAQRQSPIKSTEYGKLYQDFRRKLKAIDPNIELGLVLPENFRRTAQGDDNAWWNGAIEGAGRSIDYIVLHKYQSPKRRGFLKRGSRMGEFLKRVNAKMKADFGKTWPIHLTEWNLSNRQANDPNGIKFDTIGHALFVADGLLDEADNNVRVADYWPLVGKVDQGLIAPDHTLNAAGKAMKLIERFAGWRMSVPQEELAGGLEARIFAGEGQQRGAVIINWQPLGRALDWKRLTGDCTAGSETLRSVSAAGESASLDDAVQEKSVAKLRKDSVNIPGLSIMAIACN